MGAGKTTIGRQLADLLHYPFIDTDHALEKRTGVSISHIFEIEGEHGFREREAKLLAELGDPRHEQSRQPSGGAVIATGGGIILRESNRQVMRKSGKVIYLRASAQLLWSRLQGNRARPLLNAPDPQSKITELLEARGPLYTAEADFIVDVGAEPASKMARRLQTLLQPDLRPDEDRCR